MAIEGRSDAQAGGASGSAWSAAARAPSSAPCTASPRAWTTTTSWSPARCRRRRKGAPLGRRRSASRPTASTATSRDGEGRGGAAGRHRGGGDRHAQPHARRAGRGLPRSRHPRHLRQAADADRWRRRKQLKAAVEKSRPRLRRHPQLHRLSAGAAGARDGRGRRARRAPRRAGRISAGLADRGRSRRPARSRPPGAPTRSARAPAALGDIGTHAYNLADFVTGLSSTSCRPISPPSSRAGARRQRPDAAALRRAARAGCCGRARWRPATRTVCGCASTASKGGLEWRQEEPNQLSVRPFGEPPQILTRGGAGSARGGGARDPHPARPSRGLSRRLRQHLYRGRRRHPRRARTARSRPRRAVPDHRGRRQGHGVHRGGAEVSSQGQWVKP